VGLRSNTGAVQSRGSGDPGAFFALLAVQVLERYSVFRGAAAAPSSIFRRPFLSTSCLPIEGYEYGLKVLWRIWCPPATQGCAPSGTGLLYRLHDLGAVSNVQGDGSPGLVYEVLKFH
jgi:hypothetical protein